MKYKSQLLKQLALFFRSLLIIFEVGQSMKYKLVAIIALIILMSGCSTVSPWQRGTLAKSEMSWAPDKLENTLDGHIYFSKEASSGGTAAAGGGCGCN
ncbi:MAG: hypothetical protein ACI9S6_001454 [Reinekea sp.]